MPRYVELVVSFVPAGDALIGHGCQLGPGDGGSNSFLKKKKKKKKKKNVCYWHKADFGRFFKVLSRNFATVPSDASFRLISIKDRPDGW